LRGNGSCSPADDHPGDDPRRPHARHRLHYYDYDVPRTREADEPEAAGHAGRRPAATPQRRTQDDLDLAISSGLISYGSRRGAGERRIRGGRGEIFGLPGPNGGKTTSSAFCHPAPRSAGRCFLGLTSPQNPSRFVRRSVTFSPPASIASSKARESRVAGVLVMASWHARGAYR
jgi:hypothetical protein